MELTQSWRAVLPPAVLARYEVAETRNAAAVMRATTPQAFEEMVEALQGFTLTLDKLTTPGGNKSVIAREWDEAFRQRGWREARFDQALETTLTMYRWLGAQSAEQDRVVPTANRYGGHKLDNVKGRAALEVEWNPKDGNGHQPSAPTRC